MISFPFDSIESTLEDQVQYDRAVDSDTFAIYMQSFFTNGISADISKCLQVVESPGEMAVNVNPGLAVINGRFAYEENIRKLVLQASEDYDRIDAVVLRLNKANRDIDLYVVKGTKAQSPTAPALTREGDIYELRLANVFVPKLTTEVKQEKITDTRLNLNDCGVISFTGQKVDTTEIFNQYNDKMNDIIDAYNSALDGTMAGKLQQEINNLKNVKEITLGTSWVNGSQTVQVEGIVEDNQPSLDIKLNNVADKNLHEDEWAKIQYALCGNGSITFYLRNKEDPTTTQITVRIKGV